MQLQDEHITPVEELEDGSTVYEIGPDNEEQISNNDFIMVPKNWTAKMTKGDIIS